MFFFNHFTYQHFLFLSFPFLDIKEDQGKREFDEGERGKRKKNLK